MEDNTIVSPGRIPGFKNDEVKVLSSSETKIGVRRKYETACRASDKRAVGSSKFFQMWEQFYPDVVISKPMTDLCITCQQNANKLQRAANLLGSEEAEILKDNQDHINSAQHEREFYRNSCTNSQKTLDNIGGYAILNRTNRNVCSLKATIHYSFDFAQQVHIPSNPMQRGIHGATCYTREFTDASHANVSNDEAGAHSRNPGRRRGDKDLCHSKEGAGSPVSTQKRERATQTCSEATAILLH